MTDRELIDRAKEVLRCWQDYDRATMIYWLRFLEDRPDQALEDRDDLLRRLAVAFACMDTASKMVSLTEPERHDILQSLRLIGPASADPPEEERRRGGEAMERIR